MTPYDILNRWAEYANVYSAQYLAHQSCDHLQKIREYDPNGLFSVMYAKIKFIQICNECTLKFIRILKEPDCLKEEREIWDMFHSDEVLLMEESLLDSIDRIVQQVTQQKQLGKRDLEQEKDALSGSIEAVVDDISKCRTDLYMNSGNPIGPINKFSTSIHVFERLAECLLALEQSDDGIYLCYINNYQSSDGYFGFFFKSNGNIFSVNDRQNEAYPGQHKSSIHGRWQEYKGLNLFPYKFIFEFENYDYKGYASKFMIDEDKLQFFNLTAPVYMPLIIAMVMIASRYTGMKADDLGVKVMLTDALLSCNVNENADDDQYALVVPENSAIALAHEQAKINMTSEDIMGIAYGEQLSHAKGRDREETGSFHVTEDAELFISLYGEGFSLDADALLKSNQHHLALSSGKDDIPDAEFIGSKERFEMLAYARGREQLTAYIREQMFKEFNAFGGRDAVVNWFNSSLSERKDAIFQMLRNHIDGKQTGVPIKAGGIPALHYQTPFNQVVSTPKKDKTLCPITGSKCSIYFVIDPQNWKQLASLMGGEDKLPKIIKGWKQHGHDVSGNPLLDMTDAVASVGTPFEWIESRCNRHYWTKQNWRDYYHHFPAIYPDWATREPEQPTMPRPTIVGFTFALGFSKRGFAKFFGVGAEVYNKILGIERE